MKTPPTSEHSHRAILRARARALARKPAQAETGPALTVVEIVVAHEHYGLELGVVGEVLPLESLAPLPGVPPFYRGIINVRGHIVAVIDLSRFFDLPERGISDLHRVILLREGELELGVLADQVVGTRLVPEASLQPALPTLTGIRAAYLRGVTAERLVVLDARRLLADPRLTVNDELGS